MKVTLGSDTYTSKNDSHDNDEDGEAERTSPSKFSKSSQYFSMVWYKKKEKEIDANDDGKKDSETLDYLKVRLVTYISNHKWNVKTS